MDEAVDIAKAASLRRIARVCQLDGRSLVLDVGCGSGVMLPYLEEMGASLPRVTGLDLSEGMLVHARRAFPSSTFARADICAFEDPEGRLYDRVIFNGCFQCIYDQEVALRHVAEELITGGGLLVISEPCGKAYSEEQREEHPRAMLHSLPSKTQLQKLVMNLGGSGSAAVHSYTSPLLSLESLEDEDDFYCAVLRRSCADF